MLNPEAMAKKPNEKALAKIPEPSNVPAPANPASALEAAFLAFLQSKTTPAALAPWEKRIFLTLAEAVEFTGLPASFLRRQIELEKLKAVRTGAGWRIARTALENLPDALAGLSAQPEQLSEHILRDIELNRLRRQGLVVPAPDDWPDAG
jgi:excisionase family DNA binding protein